MKFHNAILSLATATLTANVVDAKIWTLRGLGGANANNNNHHLDTNNNNNQEVVSNNHSESLMEERDLFVSEEQYERKLPKKKKEGGKKKKDDGGEEAEAGDAEERADDDGGKKKGSKGKKDERADDDGGKKKGSKGKKDEKIGAAILEKAPVDVVAKAGCDDIVEDDGAARFRRILKKGQKGTEKADKKEKGGGKKKKTKGTVATEVDFAEGRCGSCSTDADPTQEEIDAAGLDVPTEATDPSCDPDAGECIDTGAGDDPTLTLPDDAQGEDEVNLDEETSRRRLTGNTNHIGTFAPLSCNPVEFDCTAAAGLSSVVGAGEVVVPCGTCLVVSAILCCEEQCGEVMIA
eukprot:scaffold32715_cov160-Skeletonema_menzelii.AAC.4